MAKHITIEFDTGNAAFEQDEAAEIARLLRAMADRVERSGTLPAPKDLNGNVVGSVTTKEDE